MADPRPAGRPSDLALLWRQVRAQNRLFLRNPFSAFFSLAFPVMFLLLFGSLNGGGRIEELGGIRYIQFLAPGLLAFAVISTCYTGLVTGVAINRDEGLLKRVRGTPLPPWVYISGRIGSAVWFSVVSAVVMVVAAVLLFDLQVIGRLLPAAAVTLLCGAACFCALGMAVAAVIPNGEAAPVVANFTFLPIAFVSDLFFPTAGAPAWVGTVGSVFPVRHFAVAMEATFDPSLHGSGFQWGHLGVLALWTVAGVVVAVRFFRWEPRVGAPRGGRRRAGRASLRQEGGGGEAGGPVGGAVAPGRPGVRSPGG
jgi:ABC-2 type transport system permease protein